MKIVLCVGILAAISAVTVPCTTAQSAPSQEGTIVSVQRRNEASPPVRTGANASRAPLQSQYYGYDVSVRLNCEIYNLRYESEIDDLPSDLSANNHVPVRLTKNVMYLEFPGDTVKMRVVHHKTSETPCQQGATAK
jgi:hypothetical protein